MCNKRYISKLQNKEIGSVSRKTDSLMLFFSALCFSGWIPIWSVGALQVYLLAPGYSSPLEKEPKEGHLPISKWHRWPNVDGANSLPWNFIGIPRKPSYSAPFSLLLSSGQIPIWSVGFCHVYLLVPAFKPTREGAQGGAPSYIQVAPVAQCRWCKFLVLEFYWYPT